MGITIRKQPMRVLAATALAGGVALLSACGQGTDDAAGAPQQGGDVQQAAQHQGEKHAGTGGGNGSTTSKPVGESLTKSTGDVECGPVDAGQVLWAKDMPDGTVGCTEAFNVLDEYSKADLDQGETGTIGATRLPSGWSCATVPDPDQVGVRVVYCSDGEDDGHGGYVGGRAFHTVPADKTDNGENTGNAGTGEHPGGDTDAGEGDGAGSGGDVNCGSVGEDQTLWAKDTAAGTVGCTEAFNVLDEYGTAPTDPNGGTMREITLDSGWTCATVPDAHDTSKRVITCGEGADGRKLYTAVG